MEEQKNKNQQKNQSQKSGKQNQNKAQKNTGQQPAADSNNSKPQNKKKYNKNYSRRRNKNRRSRNKYVPRPDLIGKSEILEEDPFHKVPVECEICHSEIKNKFDSVLHYRSQKPVHLYCMIKELENIYKDKLGKKQKIYYVGGGHFAVVKEITDKRGYVLNYHVIQKIEFKEESEETEQETPSQENSANQNLQNKPDQKDQPKTKNE